MAICPNCQSRSDEVLDPCPTGDGYYCVEESHYAAIRDDDLLGVAVGGRFVVVALLGVGSMAHVYRAHQLEVDRTVALKVFRAEELLKHVRTDNREEAREKSRQRFVREARVLGKLAHPNCVVLFDFGSSDDGRYLYIAMEHVGGFSLRRAMNRGLKMGAVIEITHQVLLALREAHAIGIVHRDLKPENIILSFKYSNDEAVVKVVDFGIAKLLGKDKLDTTDVGALFGTPAYMSPEQCRGDADAVGPASDIYALGCILFEIITGRLPFEANTAMEMVRQHIGEEPLPLSPRAGLDVPDAFIEFVRRCMAKDPDDRFPDAHAALLALSDTLASTEGRGLGERIRGKLEKNRRGYGKAVVVPTNQISGVEMEPPVLQKQDAEPEREEEPPSVQVEALDESEGALRQTHDSQRLKRGSGRRDSAPAVGLILAVLAFVFTLTACVLLFYFLWQSSA